MSLFFLVFKFKYIISTSNELRRGKKVCEENVYYDGVDKKKATIMINIGL
jgi:hypothetical protein